MSVVIQEQKFKTTKEFAESILKEDEDFVDFDFFKTKRSDENVLEIAAALKQSKSLMYVRIEPQVLTREQQHILLSALLNNPNIKDLRMNGFDLTVDLIRLMSKHPNLEVLWLLGLKACCHFDDQMLSSLGEIKNLEILYVYYYEMREGFLHNFDGVVREEPAQMQENYQVTGQGLVALLSGNSPLQQLHLSDCRLKEEDTHSIEIALKTHVTLEGVRLPTILKLTSDERNNFICEQTMTKNKHKRLPSDKIGYGVNHYGQKLMRMSSSLNSKMFDMLKSQFGKTLRESLQAINFDPNAMMWDVPTSPAINSFIANEALQEAVNLIEAFPELLPSQRDEQGKTALITAAKTYSADNVTKTLLHHFNNDKLDINAQDKEGATALHYLCAYGKTSLVTALLKRGATLIKDKKGRVPVYYLSLTTAELTYILKSIHIQPSRDKNIILNGLFVHVTTQVDRDHFQLHAGLSFKDVTFFIASSEHLQALMNYGSSPVFLEKHTQEQKRDLLQQCWQLKMKFSGKSVLEACLIDREDCKPALLRDGQKGDGNKILRYGLGAAVVAGLFFMGFRLLSRHNEGTDQPTIRPKM